MPIDALCKLVLQDAKGDFVTSVVRTRQSCRLILSAAVVLTAALAADAGESLVLNIAASPVVLVLPAAESARTVSFNTAGRDAGGLAVELFDPYGNKAGSARSTDGRIEQEIPADGPRQVLIRADTATAMAFNVSTGPWALYFPNGRGSFRRLTGRQLLYFPTDNTPGVLPEIRIRLAGHSAASSLERLNIRWRVAPETLRTGPFKGRFDHSLTARCRGGEDLIHADIDCADTLIHFPDRPFAVVSRVTDKLAVVEALTTMVGTMAPARNLLPNGGFEADVDGNGLPDGGWWRYWPMGRGSVIVTDERAHSGGASLKCALPGSGEWVSPSLPVSPGDRLQLRFWAATDDLDTPAIVTMGLRRRDRVALDGEGSEVRLALPPGTGDWTRYEADLKVRDDAGHVYCSFRHGPGAKRGSIYIDDVEIRRSNRWSATVSPASRAPMIGRNQLLVRIRPAATDPSEVEVHAVSPGGTERVAISVDGRGAEIDVPVPVFFPRPGRHDVAVTVVKQEMDLITRKQPVRARFKASLNVPPLFVTRIVEPCYVCLEDKRREVSTEVTLNASASVLGDLRLAARLLGPAEKVLWQGEPVTPRQRDVAISIPIQALGVGRYFVDLTLSGAGVDKPETRRLDFRIVNRGAAVVRIDKNQKLVAGNKPFFPIGIWPFTGFWQEAADMGANTLMNWGWAAEDEENGAGTSLSWMKSLLDQAHQHDLRWMVGTPAAEAFGNRFKSTRRRVRALRDHPGLLVWEEDELIANGGTGVYESVKTIAGTIHGEDPNHPFVTGDLMVPPAAADIELPTMGTGSFINIVFPPDAHDIAMWWWYPIPLPDDADGFGHDSAYEYVSNAVKLAGDKPLWLALQAFTWNHKWKRFAGRRYPTIEEIRCMSYLAIAWGVDGLFWYGIEGGGSDTDHEDIRANPELWAQFKVFTRELRALEPVLCAADEHRQYRATPEDFAVDSVMKTVAGRKYIIAANRNRVPRAAEFQVDGLGNRAVTVLGENRTLSAAAGSFGDAFDGFGTHVYTWER